MKRAVIYTRVSLDATGEGRSVERQLKACRKLVDLRGWEIAFEESETGSALKDRPVWGKVLDLIAADQVDVVVAWHIDRMTRSMLDLERLILLSEDKGVGIATASGDIDLTSDVGRMVARILAAVARAEIERKAARQQLANAQRAHAGMPSTGGARPFGYTRNHKEIVPDEAEAIRDGAVKALAGVSMGSIARQWEAAGLVSSRAAKTGKGWSARGVKGVLVNPRYAAIRMYRGEEIGMGIWPPVLDIETHLALKAKLTHPSRMVGTTKQGRTPSNLMTGIARCSVCREPINATRKANIATYTCRPHGHLNVRRDVLDGWVSGFAVNLMSEPGWISSLAPTGNDDTDAARDEAEALRRRLDMLSESFAMGDISQSQLAAGSKRLKALLEVAEGVLTASAGRSVLQPLLDCADVSVRWTAMSLEEKRAVIEALLDVEVEPVGVGRSGSYDPAEKVAVWDKAGRLLSGRLALSCPVKE